MAAVADIKLHLLQQGLVLSLQKKYKEAMAVFRDAVTSYPRCSQALRCLALVKFIRFLKKEAGKDL